MRFLHNHNASLDVVSDPRHVGPSQGSQVPWRVLLSCLGFSAVFVTVIGNGLTLFALCHIKKPQQSSVSNLYIASLAAADIVVGGFVMVGMVLYTVVWEDEWRLGPLACDVWQAVDFIACTISLYSICAIGFDRWWNLEKPLRIFNRNRGLAKRIILVVWAGPVLVWVPALAALRHFNGGPAPGHCDVDWHPPWAVLAISVPFLYAPVLTLVFLFFRITFVIRDKLSTLQEVSIAISSATSAAIQRSPRDCTPNPIAEPNLLSPMCTGVLEVEANSIGSVSSQSVGSGSPDESAARHFLSPARCGKRVSVTSDTAFIYTKSRMRPPPLLRAKTEHLMELRMQRRADRRRPSRFSVISLKGSLGGLRRSSVHLFSDFLPGSSALSQQIRAAKAVGLLLAAFLLSWLPFLVLWPLRAFRPSAVPDSWYLVSIWANYANSTLNPILYTLCSPRVQSTLRHYCFGTSKARRKAEDAANAARRRELEQRFIRTHRRASHAPS